MTFAAGPLAGVWSRTRAVRGALARVLSGSALGQLALLAAAPLLARLYDDDAFGLLAIVTSLSAVLGAVATGCWERSVVSTRSDPIARALLALGVLTAGTVGVVAGVVAWVLRAPFASAYGVPVLEGLWWLVPATAVAIGLQRCVAAALVRSAAFGSLGVRSAVQSLAQLVVAFALAPLGGPLGLALGPLVGRAAGAAALVRRRDSTRRGTDRRSLVVAARRTARRSAASSGSAVLNASGLQLPVTLLAVAFGAGTVGLVALAARLVTAPVAVLAEGLGHVHDARFGAVLRDRAPRATATVLRTVAACSALAVAGAGLVVVAAPPVVPALLGSSWSTAVPFVQVTAVGAAAQLVAVPISRSLTLLGLPGRQLAWDAARFVATCGAVAGAALVGLGPLAAVATWMAAGSLAYLALVVLTIQGCRRWDAARSA